MGGPEIVTRFGRADAASSAESVEGQEGRLPDGDKGVEHLREIFEPKGFDDKAPKLPNRCWALGKLAIFMSFHVFSVFRLAFWPCFKRFRWVSRAF